MKVKFKNDKKYDFVNKNVENILVRGFYSDSLIHLDLLRYREVHSHFSKDVYKVYRNIHYLSKLYYLVEIENNKVTIDGKTYNALCLVDSDDVEEVEDIKVGDKVKVTNDGLIYTTYGGFFIDNNLENHLMINYQYDNSNIDMDDKYIVKYIGTHRSNGKTICVIQEIAWGENDGRVYLIGIDGLKKVD